MPTRSGRVHVATTQRNYKGKIYQTHLLRRTFRVGRQVKHETLGNISHLPDSLIDIIRRFLAGETFLPVAEAFEIQQSLPHGHVQAVLGTIRQLGLDNLISSQRCRQRDLVVAMIAERLLHPGSKLAATRSWLNTTLAEELAVADADEDELYQALDWLLARQARVEKKLARRHLSEAAVVLYDITSSYYEGHCCPLAKFGHNRDGKKDRPIFHRTADHVRAHIFLCLLAYYVEWHMRRSLAPLLFDDEQLPADRKQRDPVAPAEPSVAARKKKQLRQTEDGLPVHSFSTLLATLGTRCRNTCRAKSDRSGSTFQLLTAPTPLQSRASQLLGL